jgi:phosphoadenosine phosphosulfate reductase
MTAAHATATAIARHAKALPGYEARVAAALARLSAAAQAHAGRIVQATSLGAEDMVLTDLIARHRLPIAVATLDTGALHDQTLALLPQIAARYGIEVERHAPRADALASFAAEHGKLEAFPMRRSVEIRKACCAVRKLEPLQRLLAGRSAWITGLRRGQSDGRAEVPFAETEASTREKLSPIADWAWADVWHYIAKNEVPYNALHDAFFPSIGCAPCTRAVALGEDLRSGRWWWEQDGAKECGLHVHPLQAPAPRSQPHEPLATTP